MTDEKLCELLAEKLAARHPNDLTSAERTQLDAHVASCPLCSTKRVDYDLLTARIRQLPAVMPLAETTPAFFWRDSVSQPSRTNTTRTRQLHPIRVLPHFSHRVRSMSTGVLIAASILIASVFLLHQFVFSGFSGNAGTSRQNTVTSNICPKAVSSTTISCVAHYTGTLTDTAINLLSSMQLFIHQQQDTLSGSCNLSHPSINNVPFSGTIDARGALQFRMHIDNPTNFFIAFTGTVDKDRKSMGGTYTTSDGQSGKWIVHLVE